MTLKILVSGRPGVGKTTLIKKLSVRFPGCGFYTEEVREGGRRVGFDGVNVATGERVVLARIGETPPRVGKYSVNLKGVERLVNWLEGCEGLVYVDEIGPMELLHPSFAPSVEGAVRRVDIFVGTVHRRIAREWAQRLGARLFWLTEENREKVLEEITSLLLSGSRRTP